MKQINNTIKIVSVMLFILLLGTKGYSLTVLEAIEKIVNDSPEIRIILEKREQSVADYRDQRSSYLPKVSVGLTREYTKDSPILKPSASSWNAINKFELVLEQRIFDIESLSRIYASGQSLQSKEFENQKSLESLIQLAITAYYDVIQAEYLIAIAREYLKNIREIERLIINMRNQGDATLGDINIVQSKVAAATSDFISSEANLDKVRVNLAYLLDLLTKNNAALVTKDVLPELTNKDFFDLADKMLTLMPISVEELQEQTMRNNASILYYRSELCSLGYLVESQQARKLPTVLLSAVLKNEEVVGNSNLKREGKLDIVARYNIIDGGSTTASIKKAQSALRELQYQYDQATRETKSAAYSNFNQLKSLEQQRMSVKKEIESAEEVDKIYTLQFKFATRNLIDRLENLARYHEARRKLVAIDYGVLMSRTEVLIQSGRFIEFFGFENYIDVTNLELC